MQVAIVCPYSFAAPGGVQEQAQGLARHLRDQGHRVSLFAPDMGAAAEGLDKIATISLGRSVRIPTNGSVAPLGVDPRMLVRYELALDPAEVVHLHEPFLPASLVALARTPKGVPVVGSFHAAAARHMPYEITRPILGRLARRLTATTASSPVSRALIRRYVSWLDPHVVPNGVDVGSFERAEPDPWMRSLGRTILFVGRDEPRKGFDTVLHSFEAVADRHPDVHLVATVPPDAARRGDGRTASRIHCIGPQPRQRLVGLFRAADIYCAPNSGRESFGVILVEAMAAGCAVLASDLPGFRSAGGGAVDYLPPSHVGAWKTGLERLLSDEDHRLQLAAGGLERARMFDWPVIAGRMSEIYEKALAA